MISSIKSSEIFGGEIQYFRLDPKYWEEIIKKLADTGLKTVSSYVQWFSHAVGEPSKEHPAGVLDFEGKTNPSLNLRLFLELIEKYGLNFCFRPGPFCCNEAVYGGYPKWIVMGQPEMMVWDYQNRTTKGYWIAKAEGSQPSYLHPIYLDWCRKWFEEVDKIVLPHLKSNGGCITTLNLDNEVSYIVQDGFLSSDYNPVNVEPGGYYHQFLTAKYGSAGNLPYPQKYACIEDVAAPRNMPDEIGDDFAYYNDWCEFKQWAMCEYIRRLREMHVANGIEDVLFLTNLNPHRPEGVPTRMPAFEEAVQGIVGYDFYRGSFMSYSGYHSMARVLKLMNSGLSYTWSAEFMAGTWNKELKTRVSDDHMRHMARCAMANGCKAINWFMFHDRDCWGDAPVSSHGHSRPSLEVLHECYDLITNKVKDWDSLKPQADVAVIYDLIQHQHTYLGDPFPCADGDLHVGKPLVDGVEAGLASREYEGLFRLIQQAGVQSEAIDIVHEIETDASHLKEVQLAFMPGSPIVESEVSDRLQAFVDGGGVLVVTGAWPMRNQAGNQIDFLGIAKPQKQQSVLEIQLGKGKIVWNGEFVAQDDPESEDLQSVGFVTALVEKYVRRPAVRIKPAAPVRWIDWKEGGGKTEYVQPRNLGEAIIQENDEEAILFIVNNYPEAARFNLEFDADRYKSVSDIFSSFKSVIDDGVVEVDLDRKSVGIYRLERK